MKGTALGERHLRHGPGRRPGPMILGMAREHVVVEHQRVAAAKQLGQTDGRRRAVRADAVEGIVFRDFAARRQRPQFSCDGLHLPS
jgi:hypothetical protein